MDGQNIYINLSIAGNNYKLQIPAHKEALIRKAVLQLNTTIDNYKKQFAGQKEQDYMAMAFISYVAEQSSTNTETLPIDFLENLRKIENLLQ